MIILHLRIMIKNVNLHINLVNNFISTPRAKKYEFKLDGFQERAILSLENGQSVLVVTKLLIYA